MTEEQIAQGTVHWKEFRKKRIGASDAPIILGVSPWSTPYQLWLQKTGRVTREQKSNWAIERGNKFEGPARARYELETGLELPPTVLVSRNFDFIMASLDGFSRDANVVLEIKIPGKEVFEAAKEGRVHEKYYPQLQQQLYVSEAEEAHFYCAQVERIQGQEVITDTALVVVKPDPEYQQMLVMKLVEFWDFVKKDIPPPLTARDAVELDDQTSVVLFAEIKKAKEQLKRAETNFDRATVNLDEAKAQFEELKENLIAYVEDLDVGLQHTRYKCLGVSLAQDKNKHWIVRLDKDENCNEAQTSANTTM